MSQTDVVKTMDPRLDLTRGSKFVLEEGARVSSLVTRKASTSNDTGITFDNIDPGSPGFIIDRKMYVKVGFNVTYNLTASAAFEINTGTLAIAQNSLDLFIATMGINICNGFRAFPISQASRTAELILNGETFTERLNNYVEPLMRYDNDFVRCKSDYSMTASLQDNASDPKLYYGANFGGLFNPGVNPALMKLRLKNTVDSSSSVFGGYGSIQNITPRGAYIGNILPASVTLAVGAAAGNYNDAGNVLAIREGALNMGGITITFGPSPGAGRSLITSITLSSPAEFVEPIMLPITKFGDKEGRGFYGVNDMRLSLVFDGNLRDKVYEGTSFRYSVLAEPDVNIAGFHLALNDININPTVTITENTAELYYNRLTPKITPELPLSNIYSDRRIKPVDTTMSVKFGVGIAEVIDSVNFGNISVGSIPKRVYAWVEPSTKDYRFPDSYATINTLGFDFNNQNSQFNGATSEQLYLMCKRNGLMMDYQQWKNHSGSVLCIDFARDVSLNDGDYPGRIGNYNFNLNINYTARRPIIDQESALLTAPGTATDVTINYRLRVIVIEEGYAIIQNQICSRVGGLIQVDPTSVPLRVVDKDQYWENIYGGSFVDDLKRYAKKGVEAAKKYAPKILDGVKTGVKYAEKYGPAVAEGLAMLAAGAGMSEKEAKRLVDQYGYEGFMEMYGSGVQAGRMPLKKKARGGAVTSKREMSRMY